MENPVFDAALRLFDLGGPVVLLLVAMSAIAASVMLYKLWQFRAAGVGRHTALRAGVDAWDTQHPAQASERIARADTYLAPVLKLGLTQHVDADRLRAEAEDRFAKLESGFRVLDTIAQLAPLLGLFGTVLGMISAFQALQDAGNQVDPSVLAGGIWVALLTTAVGLAVAMPTTLVLNWFESRMDQDRVFAERAIQTLVTPQKADLQRAQNAPQFDGQTGFVDA